MSAVLAVDGGQTGLRARFAHSETRPEADADRIVSVPGIGRLDADVDTGIAQRIEQLWRELGSPPVRVVAMGLTTMPITVAAAERLTAAVARATGAELVLAADDSITAHLAALPDLVGVSLTAGTGIACLGTAPGREIIRIDGHGILLGDDGGGFWIGREGLRAALRERERRGPTTALTALAMADFGGSSHDLGAAVHELDDPVAAITGFARRVADAASAGDRVANEIVAGAADALAATVLAAVDALSLPGDTTVALGGRVLGVVGAGTVHDRLLARLANEPVRAVPAAGTPLDGAATLGIAAIGAAGIPPSIMSAIHEHRRPPHE